METIERTIDIHVPVRMAYNQWTQFEDFPHFMEGVEEVEQVDDKRLHWVANIGGMRREWDAVIVEQIPDERIAWTSEGGLFTSGEVSFQATESQATQLTLRMQYDPVSVTEKIGDMLGVVSRRVDGDLERFKRFIETRDQETGAWRGTIQERDEGAKHVGGCG